MTRTPSHVRPRSSSLRSSSVYPLHPPESNVVLRVPHRDLTFLDRLLVGGSSLVVIGSVVWVPVCIAWAVKRWKKVTDRRKKALYAGLAFAAMALLAAGPHRNRRFGIWIRFKRWKLWTAWMRFVAAEVIVDRMDQSLDLTKDKSILAFVPHGVFPFSLALPAVSEKAQEAFGKVRPVVATATQLVPIMRDFLSWIGVVDASRSSVDKALSQGERIALVPGGIAEMFEGYPKPGTLPDEEYALIHKGFLRMAIRHGIPVVPIYCFGATKMMRRLEVPMLEKLSRLLRVSICIFYGVCGLPIPFRQRLSYVVGETIHPPPLIQSRGGTDQQVQDMHQRFCDELLRIFDRHKEAYGWGHKTLKLTC